jgi:uncharacterized membrane protein YuzA (DUF378 family)
MISAILLIIGALHLGLQGLFNFNLIQTVTFNNSLLQNIILTIIGIAALYLGFCRNFYLPFLGDCVIPPSLIQTIPPHPEADLQLVVSAPNAVKVMYWAAEPFVGQEGINKWDVAYNKFLNGGVALVENDKATLTFACPQSYWVNKYGQQKILDKHVHYRLVYPNGWVSEVKTTYVKC